MPRLRLPPLPSSKLWPVYFPKKTAKSPQSHVSLALRDFAGRLNLANPRLCDQFVRDLGIRDNEVVVEVFGGVGSLTRALASGGQSDKSEDEATKAEWIEATKDQPRFTKKSQHPSGRRPANFFPSWIETFDKETQGGKFLDESRQYLPDEPGLKQPAVVTNIEPAGSLLKYGFDAELSATVPSPLDTNPSKQAEQTGLEICKYNDRIVLAYGDPYFYETLEKVIAHPLVINHLPVTNPDAADECSKRYRKWTDEAPPLTVVYHVPQIDMGDQMLSSLMTSVLGSAEGAPSYIWRYGRLRLSLLLSRYAYDVSEPLQPLKLPAHVSE